MVRVIDNMNTGATFGIIASLKHVHHCVHANVRNTDKHIINANNKVNIVKQSVSRKSESILLLLFLIQSVQLNKHMTLLQICTYTLARTVTYTHSQS